VTALDRFQPTWHLNEVHTLHIGAARDRVMTAAATVTWGEACMARALSMVIGNRLPGDRPIIDSFGGLAGALDRSDDELLFGAIDPVTADPGTLKGLSAEEFRAFAEPGYAKIAFNFRYAADVLSTETRVTLTDQRSRLLFGLYWLLIRPGSGITRISMLRAIRRRAMSGG